MKSKRVVIKPEARSRKQTESKMSSPLFTAAIEDDWDFSASTRAFKKPDGRSASDVKVSKPDDAQPTAEPISKPKRASSRPARAAAASKKKKYVAPDSSSDYDE
jgi:hypothetical protein